MQQVRETVLKPSQISIESWDTRRLQRGAPALLEGKAGLRGEARA
jgi:hypothetical protein